MTSWWNQQLSRIFEFPTRLWGLLLIGVGFIFLLITAQKMIRHLAGPWQERYGAPVHFPSKRSQLSLLHILCWALSLLFAVLALSRPQWGTVLTQDTSKSLDLILALDISQSMNAEDLPPSRLERAKIFVDRLLAQLGPDRVALVIFAGESHLLLPFTPDHGAVKTFLATTDTSSLSYQGTSFTSVATEIRRLYQGAEKSTQEDRVLLLLTDGEDHDTAGVQQLEKLSDLGVRTVAIGCGTRKGAPVPVRNERGELQGYLKDKTGTIITSLMNETLLQEIAQKGKGIFFTLTTTGEEIPPLIQWLDSLERTEKTAETRERREDRYQLFLLLALFFWACPFLGRGFRSLRAERLTVFFLLALFSTSARASDTGAYFENRNGLKAFDKKNPQEAEAPFLRAQEKATSPAAKEQALYNLGRSLEEAGKQDEAQKAYSQLLQSETTETRARAHTALGNLAGKDKKYDEALKHYTDAVEQLNSVKKAPDWAPELAHNIAWTLKQTQEKEKNKQDQKQDQHEKNESQKQQEQQSQQPKDQPKDQNDPSKDSKPQESQQQKQEQGQEKPAQAGELSQQQVQQLLRAAEESEKKTLKRYLKGQRQKQPSTKPEKNW